MNIQHQFDLQDKVAIITGSSKGIGKAIAKGLAVKGAKVVISSRSQEACDKVAKELTDTGLIAVGIACHIGKQEQRENLVYKTIETFGRIDILVNNAAINPVFGPIEDVDPAIFDKIMEVNVKAPWALSNLVLPHKQTNKNGSIVNIASILSIRVQSFLTSYAAAKAGVVQFTRAAALELAQHNIRVNALCPGYFATEITSDWLASAEGAQLKSRIPQQRAGEIEELFGPLLLLASDAGSHMTGTSLVVDGGHVHSEL